MLKEVVPLLAHLRALKEHLFRALEKLSLPVIEPMYLWSGPLASWPSGASVSGSSLESAGLKSLPLSSRGHHGLEALLLEG